MLPDTASAASGSHVALPTSLEQVAKPTSTATPSFLSNFLNDNPYFQAGFGLMALGVGLTAMRQGVVLGTTALRRRMLVTLEINNKDRAYEWFLAWMSRQTALQAQKSRMLAPFTRSHQLSVETTVEQRKNGSSSALFKLVAGPGIHYIQYNGAWMQVKRERETRSMQLMSGTPWETVTLTTLSRDRKLFPQLLGEARDLAMRGQEGKLVIHTAWGIEWRPFGQPRLKRPLQSVVLAPGLAENIEHDIKSFLERRQWHTLSSWIFATRATWIRENIFYSGVGGSLSYDICVLNLSERGLADDKLFHLLSNAPERSFILIEDIDAAFNKRVQTSEDGYQSSVTFSGFLNALDGVASGEERLIFMTTNHVDKLDPALIRPGRVDLIEKIDDATPEQASTLFNRFYGGNEVQDVKVKELSRTLSNIVQEEMGNGRRVSMAALQGFFIRHEAEDAVTKCRDLFVARPT
ncbi:BCS1 N terminal-domain-containing protein [Pholiota molesta]|nr:BCS1 N terminal-domain-containing protein [Pholiota molesta]